MPKRESPPDWWLLTTCLALLFLGVFIVFDASFPRAMQAASTGLDRFFYLKRQALWAGLALGVLALGMRLSFWRLRNWWLALTLISAFLLIIVLIPGIGIQVNGARRWLGVGQARFQPSELAKIALIIFLAAYGTRRRSAIKDPVHGLGPALGVMAFLAALVAYQDLGTAVAMMFTGLLMVYMAGARKRHLAILCLTGALFFGGFVMHKQYRRERVTAFMNPFKAYNGAGYQPAHSLIALGSGGLTGSGIGLGLQKYLYLPAEHTDYIFATIGEELGLIGTISVLGAFVLLVVRGLTIAHRTRDRFGSLLAAGLTSMIGVQALMNVAVVTSSVPATGVPLPFISYGGSSLLFAALAIGIILNISQYPRALVSEESHREQKTRRTRSARPGPRVAAGSHRRGDRRASLSGR